MSTSWICPNGQLPLWLDDNAYVGENGYYYPNTTAGDIFTYPQICPPSIECQQARLATNFCPPQGYFEPTLCLPGHYCPDYKTMVVCPVGTYCIRGSQTPVDCPAMAYCPEGTEFRLDYGGLLLTVVMDLLLLMTFAFLRWYYEPRLSKARAVIRKRKRALADAEDVDGGSLGGYYEMANSNVKTNDNLFSRYTSVNDSEEVAGLGDPQFASAKHVLEHGFRKCNASLRLDVTFSDLGLTLPMPLNKTILKGVSGRIKPGRVTAVMGPSGAGKTTFMSVLMGKVARTSGSLRINDSSDEMYRYKKVIGYVPQEDTMMRELTVRENILFSARMRLPRQGWSDKEIQRYVDAVIEVLGLSECSDTLIGDVSSRGVSGGQRKRTNIGIELAVAPAAIFLDEPTSGLDSSAALEVCNTLRAIADLGLTVVAVIHQPRLEIFDSFDDLLLLAPGGVTAFIGPRGGAIPYFQNLGYEFRAGNNPADELLDFVAGRDYKKVRALQNAGLPRSHSVESSIMDADISAATASELAISMYGPDSLKTKLLASGSSPAHDLTESSQFFSEQWHSRGPSVSSGAFIQQSLDAIQPADLPRGSSLNSGDVKINIDKVSRGRGASFLTQVWLCHNRSVLQQYRQATTYALEMGVAMLAGGMMGAAATAVDGLYKGILKPPFILMSPSPLELMLPSLGFYVCLAVGLAGSPAGVLAFGEEKIVYYREAAAGHNTLAYYIGKSLSVFYRFILGSFHFAGIFMLLAKPLSSLSTLYTIVFTQFFCVYGLAAVMSMVVKRENSSLLAVIVSMIVGCLCGYGPSIKQFSGWGLDFVPQLSYARWGVEAWFHAESLPYREHFMVEEISAPAFGYTLDRYDLDIGICVAMGTAYRVIAYVLLIAVNRDKQR